jgi:iron complex outermembrane receptor protein
MAHSTNRNLRAALLRAVSISCIVLAQPAFAQDGRSGAAAAPTADSDQLGDILVVADKRSVNLQKAPLAITALSAETLTTANIRSSADLNGFVPGLTVARSEGVSRIVSIRGIGNEANQNDGAQPGVAYHIDGVYIASPVALNADFLDVERIDVLRGPQGTVFGQNSTGGTINVISRQPKLDSVEGYASLSAGNYNLFKGEGAINLPVSSTIAVRAAVLGVKHDGFAKATQVPGFPNGYDLDNENSLNARVLALWQPTSNFSLLLGFDYANLDEHDRAQKSIFDPDPDPRRLTQDYPGTFNVRSEVYSATAKWDLDGITIKNIASFQHLTNSHAFVRDRLTAALSSPHDLNPFADRNFHAYTEELNLSSSGDSSLQWIVGGFYLNQRSKLCVLQFGQNLGATVPSDCKVLQPGISLFDVAFQTNSTQRRESWSIYGQATYEITPSLRLTAGARYTQDTVSADVSNYYNLFGPPTSAGLKSRALTGKVSLEGDLTPQNLLYATVSRGYKPGGSNLSQTPALVPVIYQPERVTAYEVGSKNRFADGAVQLNLAAYYYSYKNLQLQLDDPVPFQGGVGNVDKSEMYGIEAEASVLLPADFRLDGTIGWERGKIRSHQLLLDGYQGNLAQLASQALGFGLFTPETIAARSAAARSAYGNDVPKLPSVTGNLTLRKTFPFASGAKLLTNASMVYRGSFQARVFNEPGIDKVPDYLLFNVGFRFQPAHGAWELEVVASNLTNKAGVSSRFVDAFGIASDANGRGVITEEYVPPRQIVATVRINF